jgi:hypothetical protein
MLILFLILYFMKYIPGPLASAMSGKIGGIVASKNHYGNVMRAHSVGHDPKSIKQMNQRAFHKFLLNHYSTINAGKMSGWANLATQITYYDSLGIPQNLTGQALYVKFNMDLYLIGESVLDDAPNYMDTIIGPSILCTPSCIATPGSEDIMIGLGVAIDLATKIVVYSSGPISKGRQNVQKFKYIKTLSSGFLDGDSIKTEYVAVFGRCPEVGTKTWFKFRQLLAANGSSSYPQKNFAIATP